MNGRRPLRAGRSPFCGSGTPPGVRDIVGSHLTVGDAAARVLISKAKDAHHVAGPGPWPRVFDG